MSIQILLFYLQIILEIEFGIFINKMLYDMQKSLFKNSLNMIDN